MTVDYEGQVPAQTPPFRSDINLLISPISLGESYLGWVYKVGSSWGVLDWDGSIMSGLVRES